MGKSKRWKRKKWSIQKFTKGGKLWEIMKKYEKVWETIRH